MSERCVIGWPRWTPVVTWSGGSWSATYPRTNLGTLPLARVARSTNATLASTQFVATLDKARAVRLMALVRHNITLNGKMRIRLYADAARTLEQYDSGWVNVWPEVYPYSTLEWEDDNYWTGNYTPEEIAGYPATRPIWLGRIITSRAVLVEIDDTTNPAGFVEVGLCEIAQGWQPSYNPAYGYTEGFRFRSEATEAQGGVKYFDRRDKPRVFRGEIQSLPRDEALARGFEVQRQADIDQPFFWFPFPDETAHWLRTAYLARLVDPGLLAYSRFQSTSLPISGEEVL